MSKVPRGYEVHDVSAYFRPLAIWIAQRIKDTRISPHAFTVSYFLIGLITGVLILHDYLICAGILVLLKNLLDTIDGSLARVRNRPSKIGRFLDADFDFLTNAIYVFAVGAWSHRSVLSVVVVFLLVELQGSVYNYYFVKYREMTRGDMTSKVVEDAKGYAWDNPQLVKLLYYVYIVFYKWQDVFIKAIDETINRNSKVYMHEGFLTAVSFLGLGVHLALLSIALLLGHPTWFYWGIYGLTLYSFGLFVYVAINTEDET